MYTISDKIGFSSGHWRSLASAFLAGFNAYSFVFYPPSMLMDKLWPDHGSFQDDQKKIRLDFLKSYGTILAEATEADTQQLSLDLESADKRHD